MSLLTPDLGLLFWMLLSFGVVFGILAKFAFPVITGAVEERRVHIEKSLEAADEANKRLESIEQQADKLLSEAQARQTEILKSAAADGDKIRQEAHERAMVETAKQMDTAKSQIELAKQKALGEIRATVAMLSVDIAEKVLRSELDDKNRQEALINTLLDEAEMGATDKLES